MVIRKRKTAKQAKELARKEIYCLKDQKTQPRR